MNIPGMDEYLAQHPLNPESPAYRGEAKGVKGYSPYGDLRTIEDVKNDLITGHKREKFEFDKIPPHRWLDIHAAAEHTGMYINSDRYEERDAEASQGNSNMPLPGLENVDFKSTAKPAPKEEPPAPNEYGVHPDSQAAIVAPISSLSGVLEKGKFTNAFEVGGGVGRQKPAEEQFDSQGNVETLYSDRRRGVEEKLFGIPYGENDPNARPVYGLVKKKESSPIRTMNGANQYGDALLEIKNPRETGKKTTITEADSFNANYPLETTNETTSPEEMDNRWGDYTEMQWHDHPEVSDIEGAHFRGAPKGENHMIGQQFLNLGIPVTNHWTHTEIQPSLFENTPYKDLPTKVDDGGRTVADTSWSQPEYNFINVTRQMRRGEPELKD